MRLLHHVACLELRQTSLIELIVRQYGNLIRSHQWVCFNDAPNDCLMLVSECRVSTLVILP